VTRPLKSLVEQLRERSGVQQRRAMSAIAAYPPVVELQPSIDFASVNARSLAQQYSMYLMRLFLAIPTSVLNSTARLNNDPAVKSFQDCATMLSRWCTGHIESGFGLAKIRNITKMIDVAKVRRSSCHRTSVAKHVPQNMAELQNYSGLMSVVDALKPFADCEEFHVRVAKS
jgi:hypothetical protein